MKCFTVIVEIALCCTIRSSSGFNLGLNFLNSAIYAISPKLSRSSLRQNLSSLHSDEVGSRDQTKCYDELGCISITDEWFDLLHRPLNLIPFDRDLINTRFIFYAPNNTKSAFEVTRDVQLLSDSGFDAKLGTKFVIHGFIDTGFSSWVLKLSQQLALIGDYNVFAVDWGGGSLPLYTQATANTRLVGLEVAHFIQFLLDEFHCDVSSIHLIGHSLGSHVAGYAGEKISGLGRITGLDPAEPYFQHMPEFVRLDPTDANFVDVIHSDGRTILLFGYGMQQPCGHFDFYPNDGKEQPGCTLAEIPLNLIHLQEYDEVQREIFACNHHRAIYYFLESLTDSKCQYVGHICQDYETFQKGQCYLCGGDGGNCAVMGIDAEKYYAKDGSRFIFYLTTGKVAPFCVHQYRVNLQLAFPPQASPWVTGRLKMGIVGSLAALKNINLSPSDNIRIDHGTNMTFLLQNNQDLGNIEEVRVDWSYTHNYLHLAAQCWMFFCNNKLFVKKIQIIDIDDTERHKAIGLRVNICGEEGTKYSGIQSGKHALFRRQC